MPLYFSFVKLLLNLKYLCSDTYKIVFRCLANHLLREMVSELVILSLVVKERLF